MAIQSNLPHEDVDFLIGYEKTLMDRNARSKNKKGIPYRIRLKSTGEFITTSSGKTIWAKLGAAKAALRNDFPRLWKHVYDPVTRASQYQHKISNQPFVHTNDMKERNEEVYQEFINNWVEFVPCP